jgi:hypothetical protein
MYKEAPKKLAFSYSHSGPSPSVGTKSTHLNAWLYDPNPTHSDNIGRIPTVVVFCPPVSLFRCPFPYPRSLSHPPFSPFPRRLWGSWSWCLYPTCWCLAGLLTVVCLPTIPTPSYILLRNPKRESSTPFEFYVMYSTTLVPQMVHLHLITLLLPEMSNFYCIPCLKGLLKLVIST